MDTTARGTRETRREQNTRERKQRVMFGAPRQALATPELPGFFLCWINDVGNRLNDAQAGGYEFTTSDDFKHTGENLAQAAWVKGESANDTRISKVTGRNEDGSPMRSYLMKLKQAWRDEDLAERQRINDEIDASLSGGNVNGEVGKNGRYIPDQGIKIGQ